MARAAQPWRRTRLSRRLSRDQRETRRQKRHRRDRERQRGGLAATPLENALWTHKEGRVL
jgi:hypothetical protein